MKDKASQGLSADHGRTPPGKAVEVTGGIGLVTPHHQREVRSDEPVAELHFRAGERDGCALEDEGHGFSSFGVGAAFELVALGTRRGRTAFNGRAREEAASMHRIGFALRLAPAEFRVAPTFVNVYDADWVTHPAK